MLDKIAVTVRDDQLPHINELADRLRAAGMQVDQVFQTIGVITGSVTRLQRVLIETMPGVAAVEDQTSVQLPPPDADVQ